MFPQSSLFTPLYVFLITLSHTAVPPLVPVTQDLRESMQSHIKLHFNNEQASDEAVLRTLPATIRRRVLRYLYLEDLHMAYIFQGCKQRFLDALLAKARVELYLPMVCRWCAGGVLVVCWWCAGGVLVVCGWFLCMHDTTTTTCL